MAQSKTFCKFLNNGLVYDHGPKEFTVSPCCYFNQEYRIDVDGDIKSQLNDHRNSWQQADVNVTCKICLDAEARNEHSYRQSANEQVVGNSDLFEFITVAASNKCNLACASCNPMTSSFWHQENKRNGVQDTKRVIELHREDHDGVVQSKFLSLFDAQDLSAVNYIKFGGGEPLMTDTHAQILAKLPHPEQITVQYTSNFSLMPRQSILDIWQKFKLVKWVASIDGVGKQFELLRWPYQWTNLLHFVDQAKNSVPGNVMFGVEHTINPLNAYYYPEFLAWFTDYLGTNLAGDISDLNLHPCQGELGLEHTPPKLREAIKTRLGQHHPVVNMLAQFPYSGSTGDLVKYMNRLDQWRNTNWRETFKEIEAYFV